jgi:hypothetical protein
MTHWGFNLLHPNPCLECREKISHKFPEISVSGGREGRGVSGEKMRGTRVSSSLPLSQ